MSRKALNRAKCKPESTNFSSFVSLLPTHVCSYRNYNFILKSNVTLPKLS